MVCSFTLFNPNLGELFGGSFWGALSGLNLARKYTFICSFKKYTFQYQGPLNFADVSIFLAKNSIFLAEIVPLLKAIVWELCWRFFSSVFSFCKIKGYYYWKYKFYRLCVRSPASRLLQIGRKLENGNDVKIFWHNVIVKFFWCCLVFVVKFSFLSMFHVNIITGSGVTTISFHKGLTRNPEIANTSVWVLPNIWRLEQVKHVKFGTNISNKILT